MNRKTILLAFLIAVCCVILAACPRKENDIEPHTSLSVKGHVLNQSNKPVSGAQVILMSRGYKFESISKENGSYSVTVIHGPQSPAGTLTVSKDGYETYQLQYNSPNELGKERDIVLKTVAPPKVESR